MATKTERDTTGEIAYLTRALKAPSLREAAHRLAERARAESWTHQEYLAACLQREVAARDAHGGEGRIRAARFPARKSLEEFDFDHSRGLKRDLITHLGTLDFVTAKENVVFLGPPGVGKTHLASALGLVAAQHRFSTYYINCHQLIEQLKKASFENRPPDKLKILAKYRMLIIDEIGYLPMGIQGANLFFSSLPDAMKRPLPSSPLTKHSPSRTRSFLTSPSPPLFSTAPFTTVPLSTLRVNPAASKNARNSCDRNSRLSIPFLSKAMPDSLHLSSADILQKFLAVFLHF